MRENNYNVNYKNQDTEYYNYKNMCANKDQKEICNDEKKWLLKL